MKTNKAVARAIDIINLIAESKDSLTITEISQSLSLPKSSTFELLYTLNDKGYLEIADKKLKTFKLGVRLFQNGITYLEKTDLRKEAHPLLEDMMLQSGETTFLATESNGKVIYLDKVERMSSIKTSSTLGSMNPMHCTGVGKALLAAYSDEKAREILCLVPLYPKTPYTITDLDSLLDELKQIRRRGYAIDDRESEVEVYCVAAPIYDSSRQPIAAISIAGLASRMADSQQRVDELGRLVINTALMVSKRLGYREDQLFMI
jgi:DNA-binding IclR family transcriptional regulator